MRHDTLASGFSVHTARVKRALLIYSRSDLDGQVMDWIFEALHQSHAHEKRFREDAINRLQEAQSKIQNSLKVSDSAVFVLPRNRINQLCA